MRCACSPHVIVVLQQGARLAHVLLLDERLQRLGELRRLRTDARLGRRCNTTTPSGQGRHADATSTPTSHMSTSKTTQFKLDLLCVNPALDPRLHWPVQVNATGC